MLSGAARLAARALYAAADAVEAAVADEHGPWCDRSKGWAPEDESGYVVPVRISASYLAAFSAAGGWRCNIRAVLLRPAGDGTYNVLFDPADEVDLVSNRNVQQQMLAAIDLADSLDESSAPLPDDVVLKLGEFRRALRRRLTTEVDE